MTETKKAPVLTLGADWSPAEPGVTRKLVALGDTLMAIRVRFEEGARGYEHAHPHEQLTLVLSGEFKFTVNGQATIIREGDCLSIPGNAIHEALALQRGELLDMFTPLREDLVK